MLKILKFNNNNKSFVDPYNPNGGPYAVGIANHPPNSFSLLPLLSSPSSKTPFGGITKTHQVSNKHKTKEARNTKNPILRPCLV